MLGVTRQADYALRAVVEIAQQPYGERISTATIAARRKIPPPFLAKIISQLVVKGILKSTRGLGGGVRLGKPAAMITALEIIEAIDGPVLLNYCVNDPDLCEMSHNCSVCALFTSAQQGLIESLQGATLDQLANGTYHPQDILHSTR